MRLLNAVLGATLVISLLAGPAGPVTAAAHPPAEPAHGIDDGTFWALWAGDDDADGRATPASAMRTLTGRTDVPFTAPPPAVPRWNRRDLREFPRTDHTRSVHPPSAELKDGRFIADAYVAVFSVHPATRAHLGSGRTPLLVRENGTVLGTADYRVTHPPNDTEGFVRRFWTIREHAVRTVRVRAAGRKLAEKSGSHTPTLRFNRLPGDGTVDFRLQAVVTATLRRRTERCTRPLLNGSCGNWTANVETISERLVVSDAVRVREYDLDVSGAIARFPDGDVGVRVRSNQPWLGLDWATGQVRTRWRFYSARNQRWDRLWISTPHGRSAVHSPVHPLTVHAYPGPRLDGADAVGATVARRRGPLRTAPRLPPDVELTTAVGRYRLTTRLRVRVEATGERPTVRARGLVRGSGRRLAGLRVVPIHPTRLTVSIRETTPTRITVVVQLTDAETGTPLATASRQGVVVVNGQHLETGANGRVIATIPRTPGVVRAEFTPGPWWQGDVGYARSSDVVYRGGRVDLARVLYRLVVGASVLLAGVFVLDRLTPGELWPPWRRL